MPTFKSRPEDFVVEEIPAYAPSGAGDHLYVTFRKRALTTDHAVKRIASELGIDARDIGVAGLKDKVAITTQTLSIPLGPKLGAEQAETALRALPSVGQETEDERDRVHFDVLGISRHPNKLRTGHLRGNRFSLWVRGLTPAEMSLATERAALAEAGIPNTFGDQRFGRHGDNATRALAFVRGETRPPRDARQARFLFSAFQSLLFNTLLDERVADGSFAIPAEGELCMRHRSVMADEEERGALFACRAEELEATRERARQREVSPTGPMWGAKMRKPEGAALEREIELLRRHAIDEEQLGKFSRLGEGVRRSLRLFPEDFRVHTDDTDIQLQFVLPKGAYATEVLAWVFPGGLTEPFQPSREPAATSSSPETLP